MSFFSDELEPEYLTAKKEGSKHQMEALFNCFLKVPRNELYHVSFFALWMNKI